MFGARILRLLRVPAVRDWSWALAIIAIGVVDLSAHPHSESFPGSVLANVVFLVGSALPLGFRRFAPSWVPLMVIAGVLAWDLTLYPVEDQASFESFLLALTAFYILGADLRGRRQVVFTATAAFVILTSSMISLVGGEAPGDVIPSLLFAGLAWVVGFVLRRRKEQAAIERARADRLAFEQGRQAAEAVIDERSRIARELHDVVAHSLSLIVVQTSAERRALQVGNSDSGATEQVLASVETTGREALVELRRLLGLIRRSDESPSRQPQPSLRYLDSLLEQVEATGAKVDIAMTGKVGELPPGLDLAAFRIVQESLTNVIKHASAATVHVLVDRRGGVLDIEVVDDGTATNGVLPEGGHGLIGMQERVAIYDGTIEAGPREPGPGFRVHVRMPVTGPGAGWS